MKKLIMSLVAMGAMAVSAFGINGTITDVTVKADGTLLVKVGTSQKVLTGTAEAKKAMYATALTAKTTGATVTAIGGTFNSQSGWVTLKLQ